MATEGLDAGLNELTSDILGPTADAPTDTDTTTVESAPQGNEPDAGAIEEPTTESTPAAPSAPAPTVPPAEQTFEINGKRYTAKEIEALATTASQFPHLQSKYTDLQRQLAQRSAQPAAPAAAPARPTVEQVKAQIRANFDSGVKQAVKDGFMEEDFATLYPDLAASMIMNRDALTAIANVVTAQQEKIAAYEAQIEGTQVLDGVRNNMVALSGQHPAFKELTDPATRESFLQYLIGIDPPMHLFETPDFMISQWVAFKKDSYLNGVAAAEQRAAQTATVRAEQRRRAVADAPVGSRPPMAPPAPKTHLDEMVEDVLTGIAPRR